MEHHSEGITFLSLGLHPDIRGEDDSDILVLSDVMPRTPDVSLQSVRNIMAIVPPATPGAARLS